ncbi:hypothetical protein UFOVP168_21 [uncultured Caudovirales phage]|uniref:Uncharacterized protein n=1 Tax=uncultured Caudovirales phage TaxID=2100421 RepID=A0A6J7WC76_9CAUD|nr:hypothetical protein UFOVP168_21 [uncultured Caudovirales phage]
MPKISLSSIRAQFPQYNDVSDQKLLIGLHKTMYPKWSSQQFYDSIDFDTERKPNATDGMSGLDKVRANLGAGMMDLVTGGKQLATDMFGSDADSAQARADVEDKRALDRNLADHTNGGTALQIAGGIIPTLAIPGLGAAQRVAAIPRAVGLAIDGGLAGGVYGAASPVGENQSRAGNTAIGAGLGAALPLALGGLRAGWQRVTPSGRAARAQERAGDQVAEGLAETATTRGGQRAALQQTLDNLRQTQVGPAPSIPLSTAAQLADPQLARLEAGSRARNGANWFDFDQNQARAVADDFTRATAEAGEQATREGSRRANWNRNWNWAERAVTPGRFDAQRTALEQHLQQALRSGESSNPQIRAMLEHIQNEMQRLGPDFGPANLQQIRANLSGRANALATDALSQAPRDAPATLRLLETMDDALNNVTNQRWQAVRDNYAGDSLLVNQSRAAGKARSQYYDPETGRVIGRSADPRGDIPKITEVGIGRALNSTRRNGQTQLSAPALQQMEAILSALRRQGIVQGVKSSATAGGGSNTASDLLADRAARQFGSAIGSQGGAAGAVAGDMVAGAAQRASNRADLMRDEVVSQALQNPDAMLQLLERQIQRGQPLSEQMANVYQMLVNRVRNRTP